MYQALYRKYRPLTFADVVGQEHIVKTLRTQIAEGNISHAYLFCGTRGTGKTSCAKILARAVNCADQRNGDPCNECTACRGILNETTMDVVEIDAATNTGVGDIRELREELIYAPAAVKYRVYIIDEVHMLSNQAFNALLKTLEEPPAHVIFVLATTEIHKIPATILSRCQRFDFKRLSPEQIAGRLSSVAKNEGFELEPAAAHLLARLADGAMRDGLSLLDRCRDGMEPVTLDRVQRIVGVVGREQLMEAVRLAWKRDASGLLKFYQQARERYAGPVQFFSDLSALLRDLLVCSVTERPEELIEADPQDLNEMIALARALPSPCIMRMMRLLQDGIWEMGRTADKGLCAEMTLIALCREELGEDLTSLSARVARLELGARPVSVPETPAPAKSAPPPEKPAEPAGAAPQTEPAAPEPAAPGGSGAPEEAPCPFWEKMKDILQADGGGNLMGFLTEAKPVVRGDCLTLSLAGDFSADFLSKKENAARLADAAARASGESYRIEIKKEEPALSAQDPLQELIEENNR